MIMEGIKKREDIVVKEKDKLYKKLEKVLKYFDDDGSVIDAISIYHGDTVTLNNGNDKEGYKFIGWVYNGKVVTEISNIKGDVSVTAKYEEVTGCNKGMIMFDFCLLLGAVLILRRRYS